VWLVFDVTGTIAVKRPKHKGVKRFEFRPNVMECMQALHASKKFHLAIWTSGTPERSLPGLLNFQEMANFSFARILTRREADLVPPGIAEKPWSTVKPLKKRQFSNLKRVILLDDTRSKSVQGEEKNMLLVPTWGGKKDDKVFKELERQLLALPVDETVDVRTHTERISDLLFESVKTA